MKSVWDKIMDLRDEVALNNVQLDKQILLKISVSVRLDLKLQGKEKWKLFVDVTRLVWLVEFVNFLRIAQEVRLF